MLADFLAESLAALMDVFVSEEEVDLNITDFAELWLSFI